VSSEGHAAVRLRKVIKTLRAGEDKPPAEVDVVWEEMLRWTLDGWAAAVERDLGRADKALADADAARGRAPTDDEVAALEECLWRLAAATEKLDALVSLAFAGEPFVIVADDPSQITMRPSPDRNKKQLQGIASPAALKLVEARGALAGERARLRRHQLMHSLAPIHQLNDLAPFIRVHHRDGRPFAYELVRWPPARWNEGIRSLTPETLFARRLHEARHGVDALVRVVEALADALEDDPITRVPQFVYFDHDTATYAIEHPSPTGPPKRFEIDFVLDDTDPLVARRVSSPSKVDPGEEIPFEDRLWRVIRVEPGKDGVDQTAICRLIESDD